METSSVEAPVVVQEEEDGEEMSTNANTSDPPISKLTQLATENESLKAQLALAQQTIVENDEEISYQQAKLQEAKLLIMEQQQRLGGKLVSFIQEDDDEKEYDANNPEDIRELKYLASLERTKRLEVEEKHAKLKNSVKSLNEEYTQFANQVKEYLGEADEPQASSSSVDEPQPSTSSAKEQPNIPSLKEAFQQLSKSVLGRLEKKEEEIKELKASLSETTQYADKLMAVIKSPQFKQPMLPPQTPPPQPPPPPAKDTAEPKTNVELKGILKKPATEGKTVTFEEPPKKPVEKDENAVKPAKIPRKAPPPIITLDDNDDDDDTSPPVSPQPIPIDSEGNEIKEVTFIPILTPTSSAAQLVGKQVKEKKTAKENSSHGYGGENENHTLFYCVCKRKYGSIGSLRSHIYYTRKERNFSCNICDRRFPYQCFLNKHLKSSHKIGRDEELVSQPTKRGPRRRTRAVRATKKIKPRSLHQRGKLGSKPVGKASGSGITSKSPCPHRQVSLSSSDQYACACGFKDARKPGLMKHIAMMKAEKLTNERVQM